jgi:hypothetical protein
MDSIPKNFNPLKEAFQAVIDVIKEESFNIKKLEQEKIDQLKNLLSIPESLESLYYNEFNLYFFDYEDFKPFEYIFPEGLKLFKCETPEYGQFIYIMRYSQDSVLSSVISP